MYEKLGQQHYDLLAYYIHCAHSTSLLLLRSFFHVCCPIRSAGVNVHSRLNVWHVQKLFGPVHRCSPVQSSSAIVYCPFLSVYTEGCDTGFLGVRYFRISVISKSDLLISRLRDSDFSRISQMRRYSQTKRGVI